ncbi:MAG: FHA domain-containing protein [Anaerolineae bacterium]|nr:FHA domain-containing protein [Anaerolineae bacterium]MDQ7036222.1 FHA domain-containing protein [Anaerolineae bacterium]
MSIKPITLMYMSGVEDGTTIDLNPKTDGSIRDADWILSIGRKDDNDICLRNDTFVSRYHARLLWRDGKWWLEDIHSTNGSFTEDEMDTFHEIRFEGTIPVECGQLFRLGRTWLRIQPDNY